MKGALTGSAGFGFAVASILICGQRRNAKLVKASTGPSTAHTFFHNSSGRNRFGSGFAVLATSLVCFFAGLFVVVLFAACGMGFLGRRPRDSGMRVRSQIGLLPTRIAALGMGRLH